MAIWPNLNSALEGSGVRRGCGLPSIVSRRNVVRSECRTGAVVTAVAVAAMEGEGMEVEEEEGEMVEGKCVKMSWSAEVEVLEWVVP